MPLHPAKQFYQLQSQLHSTKEDHVEQSPVLAHLTLGICRCFSPETQAPTKASLVPWHYQNGRVTERELLSDSSLSHAYNSCVAVSGPD